MNNDSTTQQNYKKPTFFDKLANFFDKLFGIKSEDYTSDEEAKYIDQSFDKNFIWRKKKTNSR